MFLSVLPENVSPITQTKEMRVGDESILTLEFRAYPTLTNDDVSILLDGKYYLHKWFLKFN